MSFLSTLGKIFHVVQIVAPTAEATLQIVGQATGNSTLGNIATGVMIAEQLLSGQNTGAQKKQLATAVVNSVQPGLNQQALGTSIDTLVNLLNQLQTAAAQAEAMPPATP